jgi:hypothetical protein
MFMLATPKNCLPYHDRRVRKGISRSRDQAAGWPLVRYRSNDDADVDRRLRVRDWMRAAGLPGRRGALSNLIKPELLDQLPLISI